MCVKFFVPLYTRMRLMACDLTNDQFIEFVLHLETVVREPAIG